MSAAGYTVAFVSDNSLIPDHLLSVNDVAQILRLSPQRVRQLIKAGSLVAELVGSSWVVDRTSVMELALETGSSTRLPSSARVASNPNQLRVLSFFSGAMGLDLGLEEAGLVTVLACEFDRASRETISTNRPELPLLGNIWHYEPHEIRELAGLSEDDDIDVMAGGPPCQAFSTAGRRKGFEDKRGNVFLRYLDLITRMRPKYAVLENVRGLLSMSMQPAAHDAPVDPLARGLEGVRGGALQYVVRVLENAGYSVAFNLYNSANYGSAQVRERVVLICSRDGGRVPFLEPTHSSNPSYGLPDWRTFREVTKSIEEPHHHLNFPESRLKYYRLLTSGQYWKNLPIEMQPEALGKSFYLGGGKTGFLRRLGWDKPSPTLVTHPTMPATDLGHPQEDRPLSIEEYKRIQDFPDEWEVRGSLVDQYKQVGNAVPLSLGRAIGQALVRHSRGERWNEIAGFPYSRYKNTSDRDHRSLIA